MGALKPPQYAVSRDPFGYQDPPKSPLSWSVIRDQRREERDQFALGQNASPLFPGFLRYALANVAPQGGEHELCPFWEERTEKDCLEAAKPTRTGSLVLPTMGGLLALQAAISPRRASRPLYEEYGFGTVDGEGVEDGGGRGGEGGRKRVGDGGEVVVYEKGCHVFRPGPMGSRAEELS